MQVSEHAENTSPHSYQVSIVLPASPYTQSFSIFEDFSAEFQTSTQVELQLQTENASSLAQSEALASGSRTI